MSRRESCWQVLVGELQRWPYKRQKGIDPSRRKGPRGEGVFGPGKLKLADIRQSAAAYFRGMLQQNGRLHRSYIPVSTCIPLKEARRTSAPHRHAVHHAEAKSNMRKSRNQVQAQPSGEPLPGWYLNVTSAWQGVQALVRSSVGTGRECKTSCCWKGL